MIVFCDFFFWISKSSVKDFLKTRKTILKINDLNFSYLIFNT